MSPSPPEPYAVLFYDYVDDILERRGPFREAHLEHAAAARDTGTLRYLGALGDPVHGALGVFRATAEEIEAFVAADPYVVAGLVTSWRVEPWMVAVAP